MTKDFVPDSLIFHCALIIKGLKAYICSIYKGAMLPIDHQGNNSRNISKFTNVLSFIGWFVNSE